ncbi:PucR C-terminal helix-turn-helix domain-containing protein [Streptomyces sp. TLI_053]|nr:PucR C-terminal helix-turn-helix domain-containing protein [Streptomyces sp. TLI_053]
MNELTTQLHCPPRGIDRSLQGAIESFVRSLMEIVEHQSREEPAELRPATEERWEAVRQALVTSLENGWPEGGVAGTADELAGAGGADPRPPLLPPLDQNTVGQPQARRFLFDALTGRIAVSTDAVRSLATVIGWPGLPKEVQLVAMAEGRGLPRVVPPEALVVPAAPGELNILVPEPAHRGASVLQHVLDGRLAVVSPVVALGDAGSSLRWARRLFGYRRTHQPSGAGAVYVEDHLSTLLLLQDEALAGYARERLLKPLEGLTYHQRTQLGETLTAWLAAGGPSATAKALGVHPQTVRYRVRKLEKLFGPALYDPRTRLDLEIALRIHRLAPALRRSGLARQ